MLIESWVFCVIVVLQSVIADCDAGRLDFWQWLFCTAKYGDLPSATLRAERIDMLELLQEFRGPLPRATGAPSAPHSNDLRTLAWLRYLLDVLPQLDSMLGFVPQRPDVRQLRQLLRRHRLGHGAGRASIGALGRTLGVVLGAPSWFTRKAALLVHAPTESILKRVERLMPGSREAFDESPPGIHSWLYDALDFQNAWIGQLFVWRIFRNEVDDGLYQDFVDEKHDRWLPQARARMMIQHALDDEARAYLGRMVLPALTRLAFPDDRTGPDEPLAQERLLDAAAAAGLKPCAQLAHRLSNPQLRDSDALETWGNALGILRMCQLAGLDETCFAEWCYRGAIVGIRSRLAKADRSCFYPMPRKISGLSGQLRALGLRTLRPRYALKELGPEGEDVESAFEEFQAIAWKG